MGVEDLPYLLGEVGEVTAVEPDSVARSITVVDTALLERPDGIEHSAFKCVVGIYKEDEVLPPVGVAVIHESTMFPFHGASVRGNETMCHRTS